ncbi:hypothetical protein AALO_G00008390 [Alosa alosa]|uniref:Uncharacterized protein n=1 Tax=Alosa alosa TaxID=278164 RepID=A0AAV6HFK4_9TELE|nr:hypothetical protein AALO_G00008390 [Alosa alosa]
MWDTSRQHIIKLRVRTIGTGVQRSGCETRGRCAFSHAGAAALPQGSGQIKPGPNSPPTPTRTLPSALNMRASTQHVLSHTPRSQPSSRHYSGAFMFT